MKPPIRPPYSPLPHPSKGSKLILHSFAYVSETLVPPKEGEEYGYIQAGQNAGEAVGELDLQFKTFSDKAAIAAEIKRRLDAAGGLITEEVPTTINEIVDRQNQLVQKMNALTNPMNQ